MRFSTSAEDLGTVRVRFYDETALPGWGILDEKYFALKPARDEHIWIFQSPLDVAISRPWFNTGPEVDVYWLDNVTVEPVTAIPVNIHENCRLVENPGPETAAISLDGSTFLDLEGNRYKGSIVLEPFTSKVLLREPATHAQRSLLHLH
jgi:hypothetical protein